MLRRFLKTELKRCSFLFFFFRLAENNSLLNSAIFPSILRTKELGQFQQKVFQAHHLTRREKGQLNKTLCTLWCLTLVFMQTPLIGCASSTLPWLRVSCTSSALLGDDIATQIKYLLCAGQVATVFYVHNLTGTLVHCW